MVKISGMTTLQLDEFDKKAAFVLYYDNEEDANHSLLDAGLVDKLRNTKAFTHENLLAAVNQNAPDRYEALKTHSYNALFDAMVEEGILKLAVVVSGQGPVAFGMPEMFTPMQHINANRKLKRMATLISDGRYSGVTYGAAVGHMTPEAKGDGGILYLQTGDVLFLDFRERTIQFMDETAFQRGQQVFKFEHIRQQRKELAASRMKAISKRQRQVAASNRMSSHTDAAHGVVPLQVFEEADLDYQKDVVSLNLAQH